MKGPSNGRKERLNNKNFDAVPMAEDVKKKLCLALSEAYQSMGLQFWQSSYHGMPDLLESCVPLCTSLDS